VRGLKQLLGKNKGMFKEVAPLAGAWIETIMTGCPPLPYNVAPLAGAWIETGRLPKITSSSFVAPLAGAWIETLMYRVLLYPYSVAPLAGAWIETWKVTPILLRM